MARKNVQPKKSSLGICFTIMPYGGYFDSYYAHIYCPAIESCNLEPRRADDLFRPGSIVGDIWDLTKKATVILADLTGKNPNVFYELGLAHAITRPAILIAQSMDDVPFDLRGLRIIIYDRNEHNWGEHLKIKIEKAIKETIASPDEAIPTTFLDIRGVKKVEVTPEAKEWLEIKRALEIIKRGLSMRPNMGDGLGSKYGFLLNNGEVNEDAKLYVAKEFMELVKSKVALTDELNELKKNLFDQLGEDKGK